MNLLRANHYFSTNNAVHFWELLPEKIDCFSLDEFEDKLISLLRRYSGTKDIMFRDIANALNSRFRDKVLSAIDYWDYFIISPDEGIIEELEMRGIRYDAEANVKKSEYEPFKNGYIHEEDFEYIKVNKISCTDVAKLADGWYSCLPFVQVFELYSEEEIQDKYLCILHAAMFARCSSDTYLGDWYRLIGNVPEFLSRYKIKVDFSRLYHSLLAFMDLSLIWHA